MELSFSGGKFVSLDADLNYREVLKDFNNAKTIRIITYNISKKEGVDKLLDSLKDTDADIKIISNIPLRMIEYFNSNISSRAKKNIKIYINKLNPNNFSEKFKCFFNFNNHAKIVGTENIVYIGSSNFSNESAYNIECGVLIEDRTFIQNLYNNFFNKVMEDSLPYLEESFGDFIFFSSYFIKDFSYYYNKILEKLYNEYEEGYIFIGDNIFIDKEFLNDFYNYIESFDFWFNTIEEIYDEQNKNYNNEIDKIKKIFDDIDIEWLKNTISEGGSLYELINFNVQPEDILQKEFSSEVYDEINLDKYFKICMDKRNEMYQLLCNRFINDSDKFICQIKKISYILDDIISFKNKWWDFKINNKIDNTISKN